MPSNLKRRVDRLENGRHGEGRTLMAWLNEGESHETAIKRRRLEPGENDTVLLVGWVKGMDYDVFGL